MFSLALDLSRVVSPADVLAADWFTEWPAEALKGVAMAMMTETDLELGGALEGIVEMFRYSFFSCWLGTHYHLL